MRLTGLTRSLTCITKGFVRLNYVKIKRKKNEEKGKRGWMGDCKFFFFLTYSNFLPDLGSLVMGIEPVQLIEMQGKN